MKSSRRRFLFGAGGLLAYPFIGAPLRAMPAMSRVAGRNEPASGRIRALHAARYQAFVKSQQLARELRESLAPLLAAHDAGQP